MMNVCTGRAIQPWSYCRWLFHKKSKLLAKGRKYNASDSFVCSCSSMSGGTPRINEANIQMLSENLHKQIFKEKSVASHFEIEEDECGEYTNKPDVEGIKKSLQKHGLWKEDPAFMPDVHIALPELHGQNIGSHFYSIANQQLDGYIQLTKEMMNFPIPKKPETWSREPGWTKYDTETGSQTSVDYPEEDIMVFDIEVLVKEGHFPTLAVALTPKHWYSWCSEAVVKDKYRWSKNAALNDLIPLESKAGKHLIDPCMGRKKIVIGHNVGFDRSFVKEQYYTKKSNVRFIDTMSLHIALCGMTGFQRVLYQSEKKKTNRKEVREYFEEKSMRRQMVENDWIGHSTMNNLNDVYQHHCGGKPLAKSIRDVFVKGSMEDVRNEYSELVSYCAGDVGATIEVFRKLWPQFLHRFPSPVTISGMFEMSTAYLPINQNWHRYIKQSNSVYDDLQNELSRLLQKLANEACELLKDDRYEDDMWLWDLDWSVKEFKLNKATKKKKEEETSILEKVLATKDRIPKVGNHMIGYPKWYRDLCLREKDEEWKPGPSLISVSRRITPKLLRMTYNGYPLHYEDLYGWGYLVPDKHKVAVDRLKIQTMEENEKIKFPVKFLFKMCGENVADDFLSPLTDREMEEMINKAEGDMDWEERMKHLDERDIKKKAKLKDKIIEGKETKHDIGIPGCWFYKLPHKDGAGGNVGSPFSKDFLPQMESGILKSLLVTSDTVLKLTKMCSYWKMNKDRIESQMTVALEKEDLPETVTRDEMYDEDSYYGAIVPRVIPAGTITRRAVEKTWMTASNAYADRVGSEMKSMIQSPPGYHFVGADVDSQELWISAVIGDSKHKIHGSTPFGWMTLQGKKSDKTDLHSKTADTVGISRDHAKVLNYGRIYGAGQKFAETLLMQFNPNLTPLEATKKAKIIYSTTKGNRKRTDEHQNKWYGGTESEMFNMLEEVAKTQSPKTPVLGASISKVLEPDVIGDEFMTSRINWVVQSSAVDYLHLMLVCMKWLCDEYDIDCRFSISIHDEVRYLVASEDRFRAALALQITNLFTRCMFAHALGMNDLPQSVAFFSAVDIDQCLRKEVTLNCKTPSNPNGMERAYNILPGKALEIYQILKETEGSLEPPRQQKFEQKMAT